MDTWVNNIFFCVHCSIVAIANGVEIVVNVPETDIAQIKQGRKVEIVALKSI